MHSRLSHHEKETLPDLDNLKNEGVSRQFKGFFDPYPGGSVMIISANDSFKYLLNKIGATTTKGDIEAIEILPNKVLQYADTYKQLVSQLKEGMFVAPAFKNKRVTFVPLIGSKDAAIAAVWRGVRNSARMVFIGNSAVCNWLESGEKD